MSDDKTPPPEQSMDEILASIRRIISTNDGDGSGSGQPGDAAESDESPPPPAGGDDDVLDLTERIGPAAAGRHDAESVPTAADGDGGLVSGTAKAASTAAFSALAEALRRDPRTIGNLDLGGGQTLEGVVREAVRPVVREWLDRNLPALVERLVEKEIRRMASRVEDI